MIETPSKIARKYSANFGSLRKSSDKMMRSVRINFGRMNFGQSTEHFRKSLEIFGKLLKSPSKNQQNITCPLVDTNFIFSYSTRYLMSERTRR